ncbi:MAG TPA: TIGR03668 family PPOX class F420-dependent oxidoreductase [Candidatus Dormibacteraeota bacterium]|nr:TIGR03668 family PPOX class F420-dependent oxidoreductase [Candidatus Dormibacteraeota bacterium]
MVRLQTAVETDVDLPARDQRLTQAFVEGSIMDLSAEEARARLAAARVARLATVGRNGHPHLVPVTFAFWDDTIAIAVDHKPKRTLELERLRNVRADPRVTVLADHYEEEWSRLWWVRADGLARVIDEGQERREPIRRLRDKYPQYQEREPAGPVILIQVRSIKGWAYRAG